MVASVSLLWRSWDMLRPLDLGIHYDPLCPFVVVTYEDQSSETLRCARGEEMVVLSQYIRMIPAKPRSR